MRAHKKPSILVVDDEEVVRDFLERFFRLKGLEVAVAENGEKAVESMRAKASDIVFLDVRMPQMNGMEALREIKKIAPSAKFVMMTGYAVDDILKESRKEGAIASIKKPFDMTQLSALIEGLSLQKTGDKKMTIMVIDDEEVVRKFFVRLLRDYIVITAESGAEALEKIKKEKVDLVFLDIVLKDINGLELARTITQASPATEIILITGDPLKGEETKGLGVRGCFWKPFEIDMILAEVDSVKQLKGL